MVDLYNDVYNMLKANVDNEDDIKKLMEDIIQYGANTGLINELIYTHHIEQFIKDNLSDVFEVLEEMLNNNIITEIPCDISKISWLVIEYVVANLYEREDLINI